MPPRAILHRDEPTAEPLTGNVKGTRADWLNVAMDVLISHGVEQVKVLALAERMGVSRSSFYWYFKSRQDLLDALTDAYDNFISRQPGFIAAGLHVNDAQTRIANSSQWKRREDFMAMLRSPEMRERNRKINELCRSFEPVMSDVAAVSGGCGPGPGQAAGRPAPP